MHSITASNHSIWNLLYKAKSVLIFSLFRLLSLSLSLWVPFSCSLLGEKEVKALTKPERGSFSPANRFLRTLSCDRLVKHSFEIKASSFWRKCYYKLHGSCVSENSGFWLG